MQFVSVNEWDNNKGSRLFNSAVKGIWEKSAWSSKMGANKPTTVLMVNANATPDDLKFEHGVRSKVSMIATSPDRLSHDRKLAITRQMVKDAKDNHVYLPSILGIGNMSHKKGQLGPC
jgi:hypothetical protein